MLLRISLSESASLSRGANRDRRAAAARLCGLFSFDHAVMEAALAHVVRNKAEAAYAWGHGVLRDAHDERVGSEHRPPDSAPLGAGSGPARRVVPVSHLRTGPRARAAGRHRGLCPGHGAHPLGITQPGQLPNPPDIVASTVLRSDELARVIERAHRTKEGPQGGLPAGISSKRGHRQGESGLTGVGLGQQKTPGAYHAAEAGPGCTR